MIDFVSARRAMVDCQVRPSDVTNFGIIAAMQHVPRERFVPAAMRDVAYSEAEISLGQGRVLMPARTFAKMLEAASIGADDLVLDLAPASGYSSAVMARLAAAVVAIEPDGEFARLAISNLAELDIDNVAVAEGDLVAGDPAHGPYDVIMINGAVDWVPETLSDQLKPGGRLVCVFACNGAGQCRVVIRGPESVSERYAFDATLPVLPAFVKDAAFAF